MILALIIISCHVSDYATCLRRNVAELWLRHCSTLLDTRISVHLIMLASFNLRVLRRPGDGACLYWSVGTGRGDYDESSFDLQGDGVMRSPITYLNLPKSQVLMAQMMSDRNEVGTWLLDPANGFTLRNEKTLWINHSFSRRRGLMDAANWTPPRGMVLDEVEIQKHRANPREWATDPQIKAYAVVKGIDVVSISLQDNGHVTDGAILYSHAGTEVAQVVSFVADVMPRIEAQRKSSGPPSIIVIVHSPGHFDAVVDLEPPPCNKPDADKEVRRLPPPSRAVWRAHIESSRASTREAHASRAACPNLAASGHRTHDCDRVTRSRFLSLLLHVGEGGATEP